MDFIYVVPLRNNKAPAMLYALQQFVAEVGRPRLLKSDRAPETLGDHTPFNTFCRKFDISRKYWEAGRHEGNRAESAIRELKRRWKFDMYRKRIPHRFWDKALCYHGEILTLLSRRQDGKTGWEHVFGQTPDISNWLEFTFYTPVWYIHDHENTMVTSNSRIGRWLGVNHSVDNKLCYFVLTDQHKVIARHSVQALTEQELVTPEIQERLKKFDDEIQKKKDDIVYDHSDFPDDNVLHINSDAGPLTDDGEPHPFDPNHNDDAVLDHDDIMLAVEEPNAHDKMIGAEALLPRGGEVAEAVVVKRARDKDGKYIGTANANPLLDSRRYLVRFKTGDEEEFAANEIAENLYAMCDNQGRQYQLIDDVVEHRCTSELLPEEAATVIVNGKESFVHTTKGWEFLIQWKVGEPTWVPLKDLKKSNPIELAEYALSRQLQDKPAFRWWVKDVIRKRDNFIGKVKSRYWKTTHKYGVRLPHSVEEAQRLDSESGTTLWHDAIMKEMKHVRPAFKPWDGSIDEAKHQLRGYQRIRCHMIFDVKMDFTRKARFVAGGHTTETPTALTYSSVVSRDSVRLILLTAALNDVPLLAADIGNAYLNATCREKIYTVAGAEFGDLKGKVLIIERALYGLKSSGAAWRSMLRETILDMEFLDTVADHDVYRRLAVKPNGDKYYEYICVYVDDLLVSSHRAQEIMDTFGKTYRLKEEAKEPDIYLGASIRKVTKEDDSYYWEMNSEKYVKSMVKRVVEYAKEKNIPLPGRKRSYTPLPSSYHPELETSEMLEAEDATTYQEFIGMLRWACELGRIDILLETALMSQYLAAPRKGHLDKLFNIFSYLRDNLSFPLSFKHSRMNNDRTKFKEVDWKEFYPEAEEVIPLNVPPSMGSPITITVWVDANHAGNLANRRSHTGFIIYVNQAPIVWYSKKQSTVEASSFGSEFNALRIAMEHVVGIRFKLRMFGLNVKDYTCIWCDNEALDNNSSVPSHALNKKHNAVSFHMVREVVASGAARVAHVSGIENPADLFTKILAKNKRFQFIEQLTGNVVNRSKGGDF